MENKKDKANKHKRAVCSITFYEYFRFTGRNWLRIISLFFLLAHCFSSFAQKTNEAVKQGNDAYRKNDYINAVKQYQKALQYDADNNAAKFNLANALQRSNDAEKSAEEYNDVINHTADADLQAKAYYNKALASLQQNKLEEAIESFKQSLRLAPNDREARENLQKALETKKQQQPQQQPPKQEKKPPLQNQKQQKQQQMNRQMMEQKFKELEQQEKALQKEVQKQKTNSPDNEKDW